MKRIFLVCAYLLCASQNGFLAARVVVPGSSINPATTLPVLISNFVPVLNELADGVFITAGQAGAQEFSLAGYSTVLQKFIPYAPESVTLNGETAQNPLYDAAIDLVGFMPSQLSSFFIIPDKNNPKLFFWQRHNTLFSIDTLADAAGNPASTAVDMVGSSLSNVYIAVTPQASTHFGDAGSGVVVAYGTNTDIQTSTAASPLDQTSGAFTLGTAPVTINDGVSLAWSIPLTMVYAGAGSMTGGPAATDRCALVARGMRVGGSATVMFTTILNPAFDPNTLVSGTNYGLIGVGASLSGIVYRMQMMETSTRQPLLVMVGRMLEGSEVADDVKNEVFAYPLTLVLGTGVQNGKLIEAQSGYLAKKGSLSEPALVASDLYITAELPVRVGQGPLPAGVIINSLQINGDAVYAIVDDATFPGVYMSRALFDANGIVNTWTPWTRVINTPTPIFDAALNTITGVWFALTSDNIVANTVMQTEWLADTKLTGVSAALMRLTAPEPESITALNGYDYRTAGMGDITALVCTERAQVILAQTGVAINTNPFIYDQLPDSAYDVDPIIAENTELATPVGANPLVLIRGGDLKDMAPLTTAAIVHSFGIQQSWLCVGGVGGVTIWATPAGDGWGDAFSGDLSALPVGLVMQKLGNYTDVRTLYADSPYLYVATPYQVDRIDLSNGIANASITTIAKVGVTLVGTSPDTIITDIAFSRGLGFIATTLGLYKTKVGTSALDTEPQWELFELPESELPIKAITGYGRDGLPTTLAQGGDCWILSGTARNNRSIINRLATQCFSGAVTEEAVLPFFCDSFIPQKPSFFLDFGEYKDSVVSDGAEYLFARSVQGPTFASIRTPNVRSYLAQPRSGNRFVGVQALPMLPIPRAADGVLDTNADINVLMQEPATGAWYIATNSGLIVQG